MDAAQENGNAAIREIAQHNALLAWVTGRIDLQPDKVCAEFLLNLANWLAFYTREHFGLQQRLFRECCFNPELADRAIAQFQYRRRLAELCLDIVRGDPTVTGRMRALCHEVLSDAQIHDGPFFDFIQSKGLDPVVRKRPRPDQLHACAGHLFDSDGQ